MIDPNTKFIVTCKGCGKDKEIKRRDYLVAKSNGQTEFWHKICHTNRLRGKHIESYH